MIDAMIKIVSANNNNNNDGGIRFRRRGVHRIIGEQTIHGNETPESTCGDPAQNLGSSAVPPLKAT